MAGDLDECTTYIKLYRKSMENEIFQELPYDRWHAFEFLLLSARRFPTVKVFKGKQINLEVGQLIYGESNLAEKWGWSRGKVRRFLDLLESLGMITKVGTPCGTLITIENYTKYQCDETANGTSDGTANGTTDGTQRKKDKKDNIYIRQNDEIVSCYHDTCKSLARVRTLTEKRKSSISARLHDGYTLDDFRELFDKAEKSDFLSGRSGNWKASFDWLINPNNMVKVLEGNYDNKVSAEEPVKKYSFKPKG